MFAENVTLFPPQKMSSRKKTREWGIRCIDSSVDLSTDEGNYIRKSMYNKRINYDLYNGIVDLNDIERVFNPKGYKANAFPARPQNYQVEIPYFQVLIGEESSRRFDWKVRVINEDAISKHEELKREDVFNLFMDAINSEEYDEENVKRRLDSIEKYYHFEYRDMRELSATRMLEYLWRELDMKQMFNRGFHDVLIAAEEIYALDIIAGEPKVRKVDPLHLYTLRSGRSHKIEDSDIIVEESYMSMGEVVDNYYEELAPDDIDSLETGHRTYNTNKTVAGPSVFDSAEQSVDIGDAVLLDQNDYSVGSSSGAYDEDGNIRVVRVCWKSKRKIGKLKSYDKNGDVQYDFVAEGYSPRKEKGEEVDWFWVNEWWEGTKIANEIYVKIQPYPVNIYGLDDLQLKTSPYIGTVYNVNSSESVSLMDRIKPSKYQYNLFRTLIEQAFAKNIGKVMPFDVSKIPDGWTTDELIHFIKSTNIFPFDPFNEINKGAMQGKSSHVYNQSGGVIDMEMGNYIQQHMLMLQLIEDEISQISGITPQRMGNVHQRETVRGVNRSIEKSSHVTEEWFMLHDNTKVRVMKNLLEVAKKAYRGKKKKLQYIDDGLRRHILTVDGDDVWEGDYGINISNSQSDNELLSMMKDLAHAGMQTGSVTFSQLMSIFSSDSISNIRNKIEQSEAEQEVKRMEAEERGQKVLLEQESMRLKAKQAEMSANEAIERIKQNSDIMTTQMINEKDILIADKKMTTDEKMAELKRLNMELEKQMREKELEEKRRSNMANEQIKINSNKNK